MGPAGDKSPVGPRLRPVQLNGHALVQRVRHAHVQTMHRSDPVPLEGPPRFAHAALFVGSTATFSRSWVVPELMAPHAVKPIGRKE